MIKRWLELRRWRKCLQAGDQVKLPRSNTVVRIAILDLKHKEATVWDHDILDYETYPIRKLLKP